MPIIILEDYDLTDPSIPLCSELEAEWAALKALNPEIEPFEIWAADRTCRKG